MPAMLWGERIAEVLHDSGISQAKIARACGITRSAVTQWKDSPPDFIPGAPHCFAIADLTGYSARWLATGKPPKRLTEKAEITKMRELWDKYHAAPDEARQAIDALLHFRIESVNQSEDKKKGQPKR